MDHQMYKSAELEKYGLLATGKFCGEVADIKVILPYIVADGQFRLFS